MLPSRLLTLFQSWRQRSGVRTRLLLLMVALGVPFVAYLLISVRLSLDAERDQARREVRASALLAAARIDERLGRGLWLLNSLCRSLGPMMGDPVRVEAVLRGLGPDVASEIYNLSVWRPDGSYVSSLVPAVGARMPSIAAKPYFQEILRTRALVVVSPISSSVTGEPLVGFGAPVMQGDRLVGVVGLALRLERLQKLLDHQDGASTQVTISVIDTHGTVVSRSHDAAQWLGRRAVTDAHGLALLQQRQPGTSERFSFDGVPTIYGHAPVTALPWRVFVGVPTEVAIAPAMAQLRQSLLFGTAMLALGLLLAMWVADRIARPLRQLGEAAARFGRGERFEPVRTEGACEIALLATTLTRSAQALTQRTEALQESRALLRKATNQVPALLALIDRDERFRFANDVHREWLGLDPLALAGQPLSQALDETTRALLQPHLQAAWNGESRACEHRLPTRQGDRWVEVRVVPGFHDGSTASVDELCLMVLDISERRRAQENLARSEERLNLALEGSAMALFDWHIPSGRIYLSPQSSVLRGGPPEEQVATPKEQLALVHPDDVEPLLAKLKRALRGDTDDYMIEVRLRRFDGGWLWVRRHGRVFERDAAGRAVRLAGTEVDITQRKADEERLRQLAEFDPLTGLPNRALFLDRLQQSVSRARRTRQPMAVMYLDIDHFKQVNDNLGHAAGDEVLKALAQRLAGGVRRSDTAARLAGDEFTVILEALALPDDARQVAQNLVMGARQPVVLAGAEVSFTISVGVAVWTGQGELDGQVLLRHADAALYQAKRQGRDRCEVVHLDAGAAPSAPG